jgi:hypothetical protein
MAGQLASIISAVLLAEVLSLRIVRCVNCRSIGPFFEMGHWETLFVLSCATITNVAIAYESGSFGAWAAVCVWVVVTVLAARKPPKGIPDKPPGHTPGAPSQVN